MSARIEMPEILAAVEQAHDEYVEWLAELDARDEPWFSKGNRAEQGADRGAPSHVIAEVLATGTTRSRAWREYMDELDLDSLAGLEWERR